MKTIYQLFVNGIPKAQPRPRLASNGKVFNPRSADAWKEEVKAAFVSCRRETISTPVYLKVIFYLPTPKRKNKNDIENMKHNVKPDLDNLLKALMDAMTNVRIWEDDALVFKIESEKWYSPTKTGARIIIEA
jgi:Holliday junction resolvase RusA-like endonuclease